MTTGSDTLEMTPLGVLTGRGLVSAEQVEGARRFRMCHNAVWGEIGGPRLGSGTLSWVAAAPGVEDADIAASRLQRGSREEMLDRAFDTYNAYKKTLSALHWELLHWLCVYGETSGWHSYGWLEQQIRRQDLRWAEGEIVSRPDSAVLPMARQTLLAIRQALQLMADGTIRAPSRRRHEGASYTAFNEQAVL